MRDPPADWFIQNYFGFKAPAESGGLQRSVDPAFEKARENTRRMGELVRASGGSLDAGQTPGSM